MSKLYFFVLPAWSVTSKDITFRPFIFSSLTEKFTCACCVRLARSSSVMLPGIITAGPSLRKVVAATAESPSDITSFKFGMISMGVSTDFVTAIVDALSFSGSADASNLLAAAISCGLVIANPIALADPAPGLMLYLSPCRASPLNSINKPGKVILELPDPTISFLELRPVQKFVVLS